MLKTKTKEQYDMKSKIESLPLYEKTYKFMLEVIGCIETFPKNSRFTLGDRIMDNSCELVAYLALAHQNWENPNTRQSCLEKYRVKYETVKILIRASFEKELISYQQQARFIQHFSNIEECLCMQAS